MQIEQFNVSPLPPVSWSISPTDKTLNREKLMLLTNKDALQSGLKKSKLK